jgi:hypothetical protein
MMVSKDQTSITDSQSTTQSSLTTRSFQLLLPDNRLLTALHRIEPIQSSPLDKVETDLCSFFGTKQQER